MHLTGTHITYYHLCHRKLWLFAHGLNMEHTSALVGEGKLIEQTSYQQRAQRWRQLSIEGIKIDHYDARAQVIKEVKKSKKREQAHIVQVKYYLYVLERYEIPVQYALLEYPKLRQSEKVFLTDEDRQQIPGWERATEAIIAREACPSLVAKSLCKHCAYYDFCYSE